MHLRDTEKHMRPPSPLLVGRCDSPNQSPLLRVLSRNRRPQKQKRKRPLPVFPSTAWASLGILPVDLCAVTPQQLEPTCMASELSLGISAAPPSFLWLFCRQVLASGFCKGQPAGGPRLVITEIKIVTSVFLTSVLSCLSSTPDLYKHVSGSIFIS